MTQAGLPDPVDRIDVETPEGPAQVRVHPPKAGQVAGTVLVGHGAGGHRDAADVLTLTRLTQDGWTVVLVDQPWRVAGRKVATRPPTLDRAWHAVTGTLAERAWQDEHDVLLPTPWVYAGRSAGARVACRTSVDQDGRALPDVAAVVCLAFPLHPPGKPASSRAEELARPLAAGVPTLVVQGRSDPFGSPEEVRSAVGAAGPTLRVHEVSGNHSPARDLDGVLATVRAFLAATTDSLGHDRSIAPKEQPPT